MKNKYLSIFLALFLSACQSALPTASPKAVAPKAPPEPQAIPYPEPILKEQFEQLAVQVMRLEAQVEQLQNRVAQLEKSATSRPNRPTVAPKPKISGSLQPPENIAAQSQLDNAKKSFAKNDFLIVIKLLRNFESGGDGSNIAQQSMFLLLKSHEKLKNCQSVINIGQRYVQRFSGNSNAAEALFSVGQCQWNIQQQDIAKDTWRILLRTYPHSAAAIRAKKIMKK